MKKTFCRKDIDSRDLKMAGGDPRDRILGKGFAGAWHYYLQLHYWRKCLPPSKGQTLLDCWSPKHAETIEGGNTFLLNMA